MTTTTDAHPSPLREKIGQGRLCFIFLGAPVAWLLQMTVSQGLAAYACYPHQTPLRMPLWQNLTTIIVIISLLCLGLSLLSSALAWQSFCLVRHERAGAGHILNTSEGRTRFLTALAISSNLMFLIAILFTACAFIFVAPCQHLPTL